MKIRLQDAKLQEIAKLITKGRYKHFTQFVVKAVEDKLKREMRNIKRVGKKDVQNIK